MLLWDAAIEELSDAAAESSSDTNSFGSQPLTKGSPPPKKSKKGEILIQKLLPRAGVSVRRPGAHVLRHSLATQMVVGGGTFKESADVLGHQSLATTEIYAKLDLGSLSQVAMPWPGGNSNE